MEIFNAASKQMDTVSAVAQAKPAETRQVEQSAGSHKAVKDSKIEELQKEKLEEVDENKLAETIEKLNKQMDDLQTNIAFGYNKKISVMYVDVLEKSSGDLIRKLPTEEAMKLSEHFKEINGIIFDKKG